MIDIGGYEYRIRPYEEIDSRIVPMSRVALATVRHEQDFNKLLDNYEGLDDERREELRMERRTGIPHFHIREQFAAWTIHGNFVNNFSITSGTEDDPETGLTRPVPATAEEILRLPSGDFTPRRTMLGLHAHRASYLRSLIVPECAEVIVPVTLAVSEHYSKWHGQVSSKEARHDRKHLQKGLRASHNILAALTDKRDPYTDLKR